MIVRSLDEAKAVDWGNGTSRRFLLQADGMGYTVTDTIVTKGTSSKLQYANHLEACYCIEGSGKVIEEDGTEHEIVPGVIYALNENDPHTLIASDHEDLRLVCMFTPALIGDEAHKLSESGIHPSVY